MDPLQSIPILKKNKKFCNPHIQKIRRNLFHVFLWKMGYYNEKSPRISPPEGFQYPYKKNSNPSSPSVTWINHCTFFLKTRAAHILTDPIWGSFCSPIPIRSFKRKHPPALGLEELEKVDIVLISHNHYDHLEKQTIQALHQRYPNICWIVPSRLSKWFKKRGIHRVYELSWWKKLDLQGIQVTALPSQHFSGRCLFDTNQSLWNGYAIELIEDQKKCYFSGDTGYNEVDFQMIGKAFQRFDLSLIPIGTYCPRKFMQTVHIDPDEAVKIHKEVGSKLSIGMHWKTFQLSDEPMDLPPYDLYLAMKKAGRPVEEFIAIDPGVPISW